MANKRKRYGAGFKFKAALEAVKERQTMSELQPGLEHRHHLYSYGQRVYVLGSGHELALVVSALLAVE